MFPTYYVRFLYKINFECKILKKFKTEYASEEREKTSSYYNVGGGPITIESDSDEDENSTELFVTTSTYKESYVEESSSEGKDFLKSHILLGLGLKIKKRSTIYTHPLPFFTPFFETKFYVFFLSIFFCEKYKNTYIFWQKKAGGVYILLTFFDF